MGPQNNLNIIKVTGNFKYVMVKRRQVLEAIQGDPNFADFAASVYKTDTLVKLRHTNQSDQIWIGAAL